MNVIKKIKNIVDDITTIPKDLKYIKDKKEATQEIIEKANLTLEPIQIKIDEKLQELMEVKESIIHSTVKEFQTHFTTIKQKDNFGFSQEEFDAILLSLQLTEKQTQNNVEPMDIVQKLNKQVTFIKKLEEDLTKDEVDYYHSQALEYSRTIENIINNYSEVIRLIYNTIALIRRYTTECNKLNKQTDHIRQQIGENYKTYTSKQKYLVQKHIYYTSKLLQLLNTPIINKDGSFNKSMMQLLEIANKFLNDAEENIFINFEKKSSFWIYIGVTLLIVTIASYLYSTLT